MTDIAPAGAAHRLVLAGAVRREVVVVDVALLGLGADRVDPLHVRGRAEGRDGQRLGLTTGEQARAVGARHQPDLDRDRPDVVEAAAVDADALVEDDPADGLLLDQVEQALADPRVAAGGLEERVGVATRLLGAHRIADRGLQLGDPSRQLVREPQQEVRGGLGVGQGAVARRELDPEEPGQVTELVRLGARVALTGDDERVQVRARREPEPAALGLLDEAEVEAHVVPDDGRIADELEELLRGRLRRGGALHVLVGDAVHLVADDRTAGVHERRPRVDDLGPLDLDRGNLEQVGHLRVRAGGLDVDDDELTLGVRRRREVEDGAGRGLDVRELLGLAEGRPHLLLDRDERLERAVSEQDGLSHHVLREEVRTGLDHHDRVPGARDDQVEVRLGELGVRRVDDELAGDPPDSNSADGPVERDLADVEGRRRGDRADDVRVVLLVGREDRDHELDVVLVALGEERPDRPVDLAGGQDRVLRRS